MGRLIFTPLAIVVASATDTSISTIDTAGVALAAIKALIVENTALREQNLSMERRVEEMEQRFDTLQQGSQRIEDLVMRMVTNQAEQVAVN